MYKNRTLKQKNPKTLKRLAIAFAIVLVSATLYIRFLQPYTSEAKQRVQLESTVQQLKATRIELQKQETTSKEQYDAQQKKLQETEQKLKDAEAQAAAKRATPVAYAATPVPADANALMDAVGIPVAERYAVNAIINGEGGWSGATRWNTSGSGAYGICQALPGNKMASAGADWATNPLTQLKWCNEYAQGYGGWIPALTFKKCVGQCYSPRTNSTVYKDHTWW